MKVVALLWLGFMLVVLVTAGFVVPWRAGAVGFGFLGGCVFFVLLGERHS